MPLKYLILTLVLLLSLHGYSQTISIESGVVNGKSYESQAFYLGLSKTDSGKFKYMVALKYFINSQPGIRYYDGLFDPELELNHAFGRAQNKPFQSFGLLSGVSYMFKQNHKFNPFASLNFGFSNYQIAYNECSANDTLSSGNTICTGVIEHAVASFKVLDLAFGYGVEVQMGKRFKISNSIGFLTGFLFVKSGSNKFSRSFINRDTYLTFTTKDARQATYRIEHEVLYFNFNLQYLLK